MATLPLSKLGGSGDRTITAAAHAGPRLRDLACCRFRGHADKILTMEPERGRRFGREFRIGAVKPVNKRGMNRAQAFGRG